MTETEPSKEPVEITRDDLFQQVWQTPMQRLAEQYGITGNGLAKICDRLSVPYPPRGYRPTPSRRRAGREEKKKARERVHPLTGFHVVFC